MTSIDQKDAEVQQLFNTMKKATSLLEKKDIANQLAKMYEKNDNYSDGVLQRRLRYSPAFTGSYRTLTSASRSEWA